MYAPDLYRALRSLYPRSAMLLVQSGDAIVYVTPVRGELCATDAGATHKQLGDALDESIARAVCGEHCTEWCPGGGVGWIVGSLDGGSSLAGVVGAVEASQRALLTAAQACSITSGNESDPAPGPYSRPTR